MLMVESQLNEGHVLNLVISHLVKAFYLFGNRIFYRLDLLL